MKAAFPIKERQGYPNTREVGMTLRDYFAAKAMNGFISNPSDNGTSFEIVVRNSYKIADKMLEERYNDI